jgi:hypothetical protein
MQNNETILFNRLLWLLQDLNSQLDSETIELIFHDLSRVSGKNQNEIAKMLEDITA